MTILDVLLYIYIYVYNFALGTSTHLGLPNVVRAWSFAHILSYSSRVFIPMWTHPRMIFRDSFHGRLTDLLPVFVTGQVNWSRSTVFSCSWIFCRLDQNLAAWRQAWVRQLSRCHLLLGQLEIIPWSGFLFPSCRCWLRCWIRLGFCDLRSLRGPRSAGYVDFAAS